MMVSFDAQQKRSGKPLLRAARKWWRVARMMAHTRDRSEWCRSTVTGACLAVSHRVRLRLTGAARISCGDVITKGKIKAHAGRCRIGSMSCLDCSTSFRYPSAELDAHTQCISEAQKYQGKLYKEKGDKRPPPSKKLKSDERAAPAAKEAAPPAAVEPVVRANDPKRHTSSRIRFLQPVAPVPVAPADQPDAALAISFAELQAAGAGGAKRVPLDAVVDAVLSSATHRARVEAAVVRSLELASERGALRFDGKKAKPAKKRK